MKKKERGDNARIKVGNKKRKGGEKWGGETGNLSGGSKDAEREEGTAAINQTKPAARETGDRQEVVSLPGGVAPATTWQGHTTSSSMR
jgi:hypothetical protein